MSREIKFRAWEIKTRQWNNDYKIRLNGSVKDFDWDDEGYFEFEVPEEEYVLEQYTGLKDKNGKEIYEGDIVEFGLSGRAERGYVAYADEYASFEVYSKRDFIFGCLFGHAGKVIGNIHENPELLGGEE